MRTRPSTRDVVMRRDLAPFEGHEFDLLVIGGGIFGACAARDAALRGLSVALIDRSDFCAATSANSYKLVHGGIRYLQHLDLGRLRQSSHARRTLLRTAPHLVQPLPVVVPTYGHGMKGKEALRAGMGLYDVLTLDRNAGVRDPDCHVPRGRTLSRAAVLERYPGLPSPYHRVLLTFSDSRPRRLASVRTIRFGDTCRTEQLRDGGVHRVFPLQMTLPVERERQSAIDGFLGESGGAECPGHRPRALRHSEALCDFVTGYRSFRVIDQQVDDSPGVL